jgi:hypothetical protein
VKWLAALLLLLAPAALADDRWPEGTPSLAPFSIEGGAITEEVLAAIKAGKYPFTFERTGGFTTYYFSSDAGGSFPAGSSAAGTLGTPENPFDATLIDNYCGTVGVECVLDSGETFVFPGTTTQNLDTGPSDEACIIIRSSDANRPAVLTTAGTAATTGPFFTISDSTGGCWTVFRDLIVVSDQADTDAASDNDNMDVFSLNSNAGQVGKALILNSRIVLTGDASDNCWAPHQTGTMVIINGHCELTSSSTGANQGWAPNHGSINIAINVTVDDNSGSGTAHDSVHFASNDAGATAEYDMQVFWLDGIIDRGTAAANDSVLEINSDAADTITATLIRVGLTGAGSGAGCLKFSLQTGEAVSVTFDQTTFTACTDGVQVEDGNLAADSPLTLVGNAFVCDAVVDNCIDMADLSWTTALTMTLTGFLYDSDDSTDVFNIETGGAAATEASDTSADYQTDIDAVSHSNTVSVNNSTVNSDDAQVQWSNGTTAFAQLNCNPINDCYEAYDTAYTRTLPTTIPAKVGFGVPVSSVRLNGTDGNIGR